MNVLNLRIFKDLVLWVEIEIPSFSSSFFSISSVVIIFHLHFWISVIIRVTMQQGTNSEFSNIKRSIKEKKKIEFNFKSSKSYISAMIYAETYNVFLNFLKFYKVASRVAERLKTWDLRKLAHIRKVLNLCWDIIQSPMSFPEKHIWH